MFKLELINNRIATAAALSSNKTQELAICNLGLK